MAKIKLTKNELKKQRDALKMFQRYLPTLQLKKQQLQLEIIKIHKKLHEAEDEIENFKKDVDEWVAVFAEPVNIAGLIRVEKIRTRVGNIAGTNIPVLDGIDFREHEYSFFDFPLWVDYGLEAVKKMILLKVSCHVLEEQDKAVKEELRITNQRVNLFEKVKIPQTRENIKKIQVYLGDMQTAAVVIGKIAKEKIEAKTEAMAGV